MSGRFTEKAFLPQMATKKSNALCREEKQKCSLTHSAKALVRKSTSLQAYKESTATANNSKQRQRHSAHFSCVNALFQCETLTNLFWQLCC